jgi:hypothetical protein
VQVEDELHGEAYVYNDIRRSLVRR